MKVIGIIENNHITGITYGVIEVDAEKKGNTRTSSAADARLSNGKLHNQRQTYQKKTKHKSKTSSKQGCRKELQNCPKANQTTATYITRETKIKCRNFLYKLLVAK